jgi:hypothetical protein
MVDIDFVAWCRKVVNHHTTLQSEQGEKEHDHGQNA